MLINCWNIVVRYCSSYSSINTKPRRVHSLIHSFIQFKFHYVGKLWSYKKNVCTCVSSAKNIATHFTCKEGLHCGPKAPLNSQGQREGGN